MRKEALNRPSSHSPRALRTHVTTHQRGAPAGDNGVSAEVCSVNTSQEGGHGLKDRLSMSETGNAGSDDTGQQHQPLTSVLSPPLQDGH